VVFACANHLGGPSTCSERPVITLPGNTLSGFVNGLAPGQKATVTLGNDGFLVSQQVVRAQAYLFSAIPPGKYFLKIDVIGTVAPKAKTIVVPDTAATITYTLTAPPQVDFSTSALGAAGFTFHWEEDASRSGQTQTANVNQPPVIQFLDAGVPVPDLAAADQLAHDYNVILSDEEQPWDAEHAYRLLETLKAIPQLVRVASNPQTLLPSKWVLTGLNLAGDIQVAYGSGAGATVVISDAAFVNATPRIITLDGVRGSFFSRRLHHALVDWVTHGGTDLAAVERILTNRYGCTTVVPDYAALTAPTTNETAASFQAFHAGELLTLINMFEEMPQGFRSIVGLKYLVRRMDGMPHPWYATAPAVAWALPASFPNGSYIEFMESGFTADADDVHRLILHEKSHFLWGYVFSDEVKQDWATLGGWYLDSTSLSGWSTTNQLEFVSAYAHLKNPNEDMAESIAYYVLDPGALMSRSPNKYAFIRDRVMHGDRYIATLPPNLTFQVLNLFPDYTYPGKIKRVDVQVDGAADQDKQVTVELELNTLQNVFAGASAASMRLYSSIGTYLDVWFVPTNAQGSILQAQFTLSKYSKSGLWRPDQIVVIDAVGNQRLEGVNDFGWRLLIDNSQEDVVPPQFVPGSLQVQLLSDTVTELDGVHPVHRAHITWQVNENRSMGAGPSVHAYLAASGNYSHQAWGPVDPGTSKAAVDIILTDFDATGDYGVPSVMMIDAAGNRTVYAFGIPGHDPMTYAHLTTSNPDSQPPEVSLNDLPAQGLHQIQISAAPTNPAAPDGETLVTIHYQARDDKSGLGVVTYRLLDPQGISHLQYHYHPNFYSTFFQGTPTDWQEYTINVVLPAGSPPGTWGLQELAVNDKALNARDYNFVETMHFVVSPGP
jgi:hypothetical protein